MVIANDHYQSTGIVCLSVIRGIQCVKRKWSISFNWNSVKKNVLSFACRGSMHRFRMKWKKINVTAGKPVLT